MAITVENQRQGSAKITGLGRFKVLGFNLSKKQLEALGVNLQNEPKVLSTREVTQKDIMTGDETKFTVESFTLSMWVELVSETVFEVYMENGKRCEKQIPNPLKGRIFRLMYNIENREWVSQTGKVQFLNGVGKSSWAANVADTADWFKGRGPVYKALRGLASVYDMLLAWTNIDVTKEDSKLMLGDTPDSIKSIFTAGDNTIVDELNSVVEAIKDTNEIHALLGVDGEYLTVYSGVILGETFNNNQAEKLYNDATGTYGFKGDFQGALRLQTYDPMAALNMTPQSSNTAEYSDNGDAPIGNTDLPF